MIHVKNVNVVTTVDFLLERKDQQYILDKLQQTFLTSEDVKCGIRGCSSDQYRHL